MDISTSLLTNLLSVPEYKYDSLKKDYEDFFNPVVVLTVNGKDFSKNTNGFVLSDVEVELSCGFEASIASFTIYNIFDKDTSKFRINPAKPYILLGSTVELAFGYGKLAKTVFCGFIAKVNFIYEEGEMPGVRVTAMDIKGIMMANNYSKQLTATSYGAAVKEIFNQNAYMNMKNSQIIKKLDIDDTPDKPLPIPGLNPPADRTIEMVCESDYEFVVKAAKKYNYEFFTQAGTVCFRKAKSDAKLLLELSPAAGLRSFDVEYDITGLVETVEARGMNTGKGKVIQAKEKSTNKISLGNKAIKCIKRSAKVYLDPTITSQEEAANRAKSVMEDISYRFGTLECECIGLPELQPGRFVKIMELGEPPANKFYVTNVKHTFSEEKGFGTKVTGKAASIKEVLALPFPLPGF